MDRAHTAALWGYVEGDRTVVGILVALIAALAVVYVVMRLAARRRSRGHRGTGSRG